MELMFNPDNGQAAGLGKKLGWNADLAKLRAGPAGRGTDGDRHPGEPQSG